MKEKLFGAFLTIIVTATGISAQAANNEDSPVVATDRYQLEKAEGGFVRLDRQSGNVSFCRMEDGNLACRLGADERAAYESALETLQEQLDAVEGRLTALENSDLGTVSPQVPDTPSDSPEPRSEQAPANPDQLKQDLDRAMDFAKDAMNRFMTVIEELKEEYRNRSEPKT